MDQLLLDLINTAGYFAIFFVIVLENVFPPIPSELVLPFSGFLCTRTNMILPGVIIASTLGSLAGAFMLYYLGHYFNRERLRKLAGSRVAKMLGFKVSDIDKAIDWFDAKGQISVLLCRFVPGIRSLISIPAGCSNMRLGRFVAYTALGSTIWNTVLCSIGFYAGDAWNDASAEATFIMDTIKNGIYIAIVVFAIYWIWKRIIPNLKKNAD